MITRSVIRSVFFVLQLTLMGFLVHVPAQARAGSWNLEADISTANASLGVTAVSDGEGISLDDLAGMIPDPGFQEGLYLERRNLNALGSDAVSMAQSKVSFNISNLCIENILVEDAQFWLGFALQAGPAGPVFAYSGMGSGAPAPLSPFAPSGIDTTYTDVYLYGPPMTLGVSPIGIGREYYDLFFPFNFETLSFNLGSVEFVGTAQNAGNAAVASLAPQAVSDPIDQWIDSQSKVNIFLPSENELEGVLMNCATKFLGVLNLDGYGNRVLQKMAENALLVPAIQENLAAGNTTDASLLMTKFISKSLLEATNSPEGLLEVAGKLSDNTDYVDAIAEGIGTGCGADFNAGLWIALKGAAWKVFPFASCGLESMYESARYAVDWINDDCIQTQYRSWANHGGEDCARDPDCLVGSCSGWIMATVSGRERNIVKHTARKYQISEDQAQSKLEEMFTKWRAAENQSYPQKTHYQQLKSQYQSLLTSDQIRMAQLVNPNAPSSVSELERFLKYKELIDKAKNQIIGGLPGGSHLTESAVNTKAKELVQAFMDSGAATYRRKLAQIIDENDPSARTIPSFCTTGGDYQPIVQAQASFPEGGASDPVETRFDLPAGSGRIRITETFSPYRRSCGYSSCYPLVDYTYYYGTGNDSFYGWTHFADAAEGKAAGLSTTYTPDPLVVGENGTVAGILSYNSDIPLPNRAIRLHPSKDCNLAGVCYQFGTAVSVTIEFLPDP